MMLIQTTVQAVIPFYERFLARFPDVGCLAGASDADVVKAWEGLGYYRRARHLHQAAKRIVELHDGCVPSTVDHLIALPGVGRYVASAVASIAFDKAEPIVEANSQRVLARLIGWGLDVRKSASQKRLWQAAEHLVSVEHPGDFNQAMIDLGAIVCTPAKPYCMLCPITSFCVAFSQGRQAEIPVIASKPVPLRGAEHAVMIVEAGKVLMLQRASDVLWGGFWEFPTTWVEGADPARRRATSGRRPSLTAALRALTGLSVEIERATYEVKYAVTRHRMVLRAQFASVEGGVITKPEGFQAMRWVAWNDLSGLAVSSATRGLLKVLPPRTDLT